MGENVTVEGAQTPGGTLRNDPFLTRSKNFAKLLGQKGCRTKVSEFFEFSSRILPRILLRIFPEFFEDFSCFISWETETRKIHKPPPHFSIQNSQANTKKLFTKFFWRAGKVTNCGAHTMRGTLGVALGVRV